MREEYSVKCPFCGKELKLVKTKREHIYHAYCPDDLFRCFVHYNTLKKSKEEWESYIEAWVSEFVNKIRKNVCPFCKVAFLGYEEYINHMVQQHGLKRETIEALIKKKPPDKGGLNK